MKKSVIFVVVFLSIFLLVGCPKQDAKKNSENSSNEKNDKKNTNDKGDIKTISHGEKVKIEDYVVKGKDTIFEFGASW